MKKQRNGADSGAEKSFEPKDRKELINKNHEIKKGLEMEIMDFSSALLQRIIWKG